MGASISVKHQLVLFLFLFIWGYGMAQSKYTISGMVTDAKTGEQLVGAAIMVKNTATGVTTNIYGFYSLTLPSGNYLFQARYIGFNTIEFEVNLTNDLTKNLHLEPESRSIDEVVISAQKRDDNIVNPIMGIDKLNLKQVEKLPVLMGEKDILKTIQLLPGVSTSSEGSTGFSVRGGATDQNLILLDEAPVFSSSHLLGFFSVFNHDAIKEATLYKGGIPAVYGGRGSSVLDIYMKEGNNNTYNISGGLGLISSRLTIEGPIKQNKSSFIISGRRSYADVVGKATGFINNDVKLYFYDLNAKINYTINQNNRLFISGYFGQDNFGISEIGSNWGNATATTRWNHVYSPKLFSNITFIYSNYKYGFDFYDDLNMQLGIEDAGFKNDFTWYLNPSNTVKFGIASTHHYFNPGQLTSASNNQINQVLDKKRAFETGLYISDNIKVNSKLNLDIGFRLSWFAQPGEGWFYTYNNINQPIDSTFYKSNQIAQNYYSLEPRTSLSYSINSNSSFKISYNRMAQNLHLLSNSTSGQPTDTWIPSSNNIKPLIVNQFAAGYFLNLFNNSIETSVEAYYKDLQHVLDYEDGADLLLNNHVEASLLEGDGRSYGIEFYVKKKHDRFNGWVSYTLSKTENRIEGINNSDWYNAKYDKTHNLSVVASYDFTDRIALSATWVYSTGNAVTFPSGKYEYNGIWIPYYTNRNEYRMPDNHRLDVNLHVEGKPDKKFTSSWDFSIYNVYNRYNAYSITFRESDTKPGAMEAVRTTLFGIVPSITWNFKF